MLGKNNIPKKKKPSLLKKFAASRRKKDNSQVEESRDDHDPYITNRFITVKDESWELSTFSESIDDEIWEMEEAIDQWQKTLDDLKVKKRSLQVKYENDVEKWNKKLKDATKARDAKLAKCDKKIQKDLDKADKIEDIKRLRLMQRLLNEKRDTPTKEMMAVGAKLKSLNEDLRIKPAEEIKHAKKMVRQLKEELTKLDNDLSKLNEQAEKSVPPDVLARMGWEKPKNRLDAIKKKFDHVKDDIEDLQTVVLDYVNDDFEELKSVVRDSMSVVLPFLRNFNDDSTDDYDTSTGGGSSFTDSEGTASTS